MIQNLISRTLIVAAAMVAFAQTASAQKAGKPTVIEGEAKAFGNPNAPQGGTFTTVLGAEPTTLNPVTGTDLYSSRIQGYILDTLMLRNPDTYEWMPGLAERAEISPDGKVITFKIRKGATFHDGKPVTVEDVKFSYDVWFDDKYNAAHMRPYYENIEKAEIVDEQTVRFTVKEPYFRNFDTLAGTEIIPKHIYGDAAAGVKKNKTIMGSGPYVFEAYNQGQNLILVRNKKWWGNNVASQKGRFNFERIRFRFIKDDNIVIEMLKKGEIDYFEDITPEGFTQKAVGPEWGKTAMKVKTENLYPKSFGYFGWNLRRELFKDVNVRQALAMLMNRPEMNKKFRFDMSLPATGPWYQQSEYADPSVKPVPFDPKKAVEILKKAGWTDSDKDGVLDKTVGGKKMNFRFTLTYGNKDTEKYWVLYQNDLKKVGIVMDLQLLEWNAMMKNRDEENFDVVAMAWGAGSVLVDPKQIWHSANAVKGGSNFIDYRNPDVDKLIDQARAEFDKAKRVKILREVYRKIAADYPYAFLFNDRYVLYAHTARIKMQKPSFKYAIGEDYWWTESK